jgi:ferredoxin
LKTNKRNKETTKVLYKLQDKLSLEPIQIQSTETLKSSGRPEKQRASFQERKIFFKNPSKTQRRVLCTSNLHMYVGCILCRTCMYTCYTETGHVHLCKFSKKKKIWTDNWEREAGRHLEGDQRPKLTQKTQKTQKRN